MTYVSFLQSFYTISCTVLFSTILPIAAIAVRQTVKKQRTETILDLKTVFEIDQAGDDRRSIASFEFVKYKYYVENGGSGRRQVPKDFSLASWVIAAVPFVAITSLAYFLIFGAVFKGYFLPIDLARQAAGSSAGQVGPQPPTVTLTWVWILAIAAVASYLAIIREMFRAIHTFDLSPSTLIRMSIEFLFGIATALVVFSVFLSNDDTVNIAHQVKYGALIIVAFVCGYIPDAGIRYLLQASRLNSFKRTDTRLYEVVKATPVEVIDGIDVTVSARLAEHEIMSVQNLATYNPILIFVETPYGIYQAVDWVAQAQLFCTAGPYAVIELWKLGIRTIFDLERATLDPACSSKALREAVARALSMPMRAQTGGGQQTMFCDADIIANIQNRLNDCHVQRLRQVVDRIRHSLKTETERLRPLGWAEAPAPICMPLAPVQ